MIEIYNEVSTTMSYYDISWQDKSEQTDVWPSSKVKVTGCVEVIKSTISGTLLDTKASSARSQAISISVADIFNLGQGHKGKPHQIFMKW